MLGTPRTVVTGSFARFFAGDSAVSHTVVRLVRVVLLGLPPVPFADHGHVRAVSEANATLSSFNHRS